MFRIVGSFIDSIIPILGGIFILTQLKHFKKPFIKWVAIVTIFAGLILLAMDINDLVKE